LGERVDLEITGAPLLVVQQDGGLILATEARGARSVADGLRRFATLEKCPGTFHHYRITRRSLWNAAASGVTPERIADFLRRASRLPLPPAVDVLIADATARYGRLRLVREGGVLWLRADDPALLPRLAPDLVPDFLPGVEAIGEDGLAVSPSLRGPLKACLARLGWPVRDEAGYVQGAPLALGWRPGVALRQYQRDAIAAFVGTGRESGATDHKEGSGLVILPCGAGKTIIGVGVTIGLGCQTLVLCPNSSSVRQWLDAFARFTDLSGEQAGEYDPRRRTLLPVTVTTYQMLTARRRAALAATHPVLPHLDRVGGHDWGLVVFDEAHLLPADVFRLAADLASRRRLGLTATPIREDGREADLAALVGPVLYDVPWGDLEAQGWIAPVECVEVRVPLLPEPATAGTRSGPTHRAVATAPEKWPIVRKLVRRYRGEGVLILGQYLDQLRDLATRLDAPLVSGETPKDEREAAFDRFRAGQEPVLVLSRVGNAAIDLPNARVAIEVSGNFGSRQEEAQRLGRLLRPKPGAGGPARFYALVADDPAEAEHAARRQRFLVEQGYRYQIVRWNEK
jgi:DNA excision repair protein ERCC-3